MPFVDPAKRREAQRRSYIKHREERLAKTKAWQRENRTRANAAYRRWRAKPDNARRLLQRRRLKDYGILPEDYDQLLTEQDGLCAICRCGGTSFVTRRGERKQYELSVDHDHITGRIRGLLCHDCNIALGFLKHNPERLHAALDYLRKAGH